MDQGGAAPLPSDTDDVRRALGLPVAAVAGGAAGGGVLLLASLVGVAIAIAVPRRRRRSGGRDDEETQRRSQQSSEASPGSSAPGTRNLSDGSPNISDRNTSEKGHGRSTAGTVNTHSDSGGGSEPAGLAATRRRNTAVADAMMAQALAAGRVLKASFASLGGISLGGTQMLGYGRLDEETQRKAAEQREAGGAGEESEESEGYWEEDTGDEDLQERLDSVLLGSEAPSTMLVWTMGDVKRARDEDPLHQAKLRIMVYAAAYVALWRQQLLLLARVLLRGEHAGAAAGHAGAVRGMGPGHVTTGPLRSRQAEELTVDFKAELEGHLGATLGSGMSAVVYKV